MGLGWGRVAALIEQCPCHLTGTGSFHGLHPKSTPLKVKMLGPFISEPSYLLFPPRPSGRLTLSVTLEPEPRLCYTEDTAVAHSALARHRVLVI